MAVHAVGDSLGVGRSRVRMAAAGFVEVASALRGGNSGRGCSDPKLTVLKHNMIIQNFKFSKLRRKFQSMMVQRIKTYQNFVESLFACVNFRYLLDKTRSSSSPLHMAEYFHFLSSPAPQNYRNTNEKYAI